MPRGRFRPGNDSIHCIGALGLQIQHIAYCLLPHWATSNIKFPCGFSGFGLDLGGCPETLGAKQREKLL